MKYHGIVVSGTFDGLHVGHQALISKAFELGDHVYIAVTTDLFIKTYKPGTSSVASQEERTNNLLSWIRAQGWEERATIVHINDPFGPVVQQNEQQDSPIDVQGIVVSSETRPGAEKVNTRRIEQGLAPLDIIEIPMELADDQEKISSTRIRKGEVDIYGKLVMPHGLRAALGQPLGKVLKREDIAPSLASAKKGIIVTVGDISTKTILDAGIVPHLAIIDGSVERKPYAATVQLIKNHQVLVHPVLSGPGFISKEGQEVIASWAKQQEKWAILVDGEEDLLTLPAIIHAPDNAIVYYGQPAIGSQETIQGLVEVMVGPEVRAKVQSLLSQFEAS